MIHLQFKSRELQTHSNYNYDGTLRTTGAIQPYNGINSAPLPNTKSTGPELQINSELLKQVILSQ
jgi:hypothetical protein